MAHVHGAPAGFADNGEGFGKDFVEDFALSGLDSIPIRDAFEARLDAGLEFRRLGAQLFV